MIQSASIGALSITSTSLQLDGEGFDEAGVTWRRQTATSPFVHGSVEVGAVQDGGTLKGRVWCLGTTYAAVIAARDSLLGAVSDYEYIVSQTVDGITDEWACYRADYVVGNASRYVTGLALPVSLIIPYQPPLAVAP